jgi:3-phenylpropionate/trans-cinnamate dioxygenase ferredoxin reductase subunit
LKEEHDLVIVGTGHAGAEAAAKLIQMGFSGSLALIGAEPDFPYDRPSLSKEYLAGDKGLERIWLRPESFWTESSICVLRGRTVVHVDSRGRSLLTADGDEIGYKKLIWAAGGRARLLRCGGADLSGVHVLRSRSDADDLRSQLSATSRVVIVGAGYIGLEVASVLAKRVESVTILEAQDRVLARVAGTAISRYYENLHRSQGITLKLAATVECLEGSDGRVTSVRVADGTSVPADVVLVGIGMDPVTIPVRDGAATGDNGVVVDEFCQTPLEGIYAIGDCALHANTYAGGALIRLESVQNATDMAAVAAKHILGKPEPYAAVPWFWSEQYHLRLQTVGLSSGHDDAVIRGDPGSGSFTVVYLKDRSVVALDCVNAARDFMQGRYLVGTRAHVPVDALQDVSRPLKSLLAG